jgi:hypothetical protein
MMQAMTTLATAIKAHGAVGGCRRPANQTLALESIRSSLLG